MPEFAIEIADLTKRYGKTEALAGLNLRVPTGSITGFLGRNGAGKTTAIKALLGMIRPTSGRASVLGYRCDDPADSIEIRRRTGFVSEDKGLYDSMTVYQHFRIVRGFFPGCREDLVRRFELPWCSKVKAFSKGMRTRLALAIALCHSAELLILDEPTSGLDPAAANDVLQLLVTEVAERGVTVFFSSHQIAEVERIADHVVIIDRGRAVLEGSLDDMRAASQTGLREIFLETVKPKEN
jgi:ABC-2 type transport system ATP-binding protein